VSANGLAFALARASAVIMVAAATRCATSLYAFHASQRLALPVPVPFDCAAVSSIAFPMHYIARADENFLSQSGLPSSSSIGHRGTTCTTTWRRAVTRAGGEVQALQSLIGTIEIDDDEIRIKGSKDLLEKAILASQSGPSGCSQTSTRWRARREAPTIMRTLCTSSRIRLACRAFDTTKVYQFANVPK
jgi:hypothetical protein